MIGDSLVGTHFSCTGKSGRETVDVPRPLGGGAFSVLGAVLKGKKTRFRFKLKLKMCAIRKSEYPPA